MKTNYKKAVCAPEDAPCVEFGLSKAETLVRKLEKVDADGNDTFDYLERPLGILNEAINEQVRALINNVAEARVREAQRKYDKAVQIAQRKFDEEVSFIKAKAFASSNNFGEARHKMNERIRAMVTRVAKGKYESAYLGDV